MYGDVCSTEPDESDRSDTHVCRVCAGILPPTHGTTVRCLRATHTTVSMRVYSCESFILVSDILNICRCGGEHRTL